MLIDWIRINDLVVAIIFQWLCACDQDWLTEFSDWLTEFSDWLRLTEFNDWLIEFFSLLDSHFHKIQIRPGDFDEDDDPTFMPDPVFEPKVSNKQVFVEKKFQSLFV